MYLVLPMDSIDNAKTFVSYSLAYDYKLLLSQVFTNIIILELRDNGTVQKKS
jgi:hypothetical protein